MASERQAGSFDMQSLKICIPSLSSREETPGLDRALLSLSPAALVAGWSPEPQSCSRDFSSEEPIATPCDSLQLCSYHVGAAC